MCRWGAMTIRDWRFLDALRRETDRSLEREPERQPWGRKVEEVVESEPMITRQREGGTGKSRHHRSGKAGQKERSGWSDAEYRRAREDYQRQNDYARREQEREAQEERDTLREKAAERRQAAREVRERVREANEAVRRGDPPPGWRR